MQASLEEEIKTNVRPLFKKLLITIIVVNVKINPRVAKYKNK